MFLELILNCVFTIFIIIFFLKICKHDECSNFKKLLLISIAIMLGYKLFKCFDKFDSIFIYGDEIYHFIDDVFDIINQLAIGIAGATLFYYLELYIKLQKNMKLYNFFNNKLSCFSELKNNEIGNNKENLPNDELIKISKEIKYDVNKLESEIKRLKSSEINKKFLSLMAKSNNFVFACEYIKDLEDPRFNKIPQDIKDASKKKTINIYIGIIELLKEIYLEINNFYFQSNKILGFLKFLNESE